MLSFFCDLLLCSIDETQLLHRANLLKFSESSLPQCAILKLKSFALILVSFEKKKIEQIETKKRWKNYNKNIDININIIYTIYNSIIEIYYYII